jgi:hypothetical protein
VGRPEIRGHVRSEQTGLPIANATVTIEELRSSWVPGNLPNRKELLRTTTSADGSFSLVLPKGKYLMIRFVQGNCKWLGIAMRLDSVDLNAPMEISLKERVCPEQKD